MRALLSRRLGSDILQVGLSLLLAMAMPTISHLPSAEEDMTREQLLRIISHLRAELAHYRRPTHQASSSSSAAPATQAPQAVPTTVSGGGNAASSMDAGGAIHQGYYVRQEQAPHVRGELHQYCDDETGLALPTQEAAPRGAPGTAQAAVPPPENNPPPGMWAPPPPPPPVPQQLQAIPQALPQDGPHGIQERALNADFSRPQFPAGIGEPEWYEYNRDQQGWLCRLCRKYVTRDHLVSQMHQRRAADPDWYLE